MIPASLNSYRHPVASRDKAADHVLWDCQRSVDDASEAIRLDPHLQLDYFNRAEAYEALGRDSESERDIAQARNPAITVQSSKGV